MTRVLYGVAENAGPENAGLIMSSLRDQNAVLENAGPKNAGPKMQGWKILVSYFLDTL